MSVLRAWGVSRNPPALASTLNIFYNGHVPAIRPDMDVYEDVRCPGLLNV